MSTDSFVVVGAGTAGCIVATRLARSGKKVILLEAGADLGLKSTLQGLESMNWIDALGESTAFYDDLNASKKFDSDPRPYRRGKGLGGSSSVNAMIALPGLPSDYNLWAEKYGLTDWSWEKVQPWFELLLPQFSQTSDEDLSPVDKALIKTGKNFDLPVGVNTYDPDDGGGKLWLTAINGKRYSSLAAYLKKVELDGNIEIRTSVKVDRILMDGEKPTGVQLHDGEVIPTTHVILTAGTFESPAILMRSGFEHEGLGKGLQDHPAISIYFSLKPEYGVTDHSKPCISSVYRASSSLSPGDLHLLPVHGKLISQESKYDGLLMAAVMKVDSTGELKLNPDNPMATPLINEGMLRAESDQQRMREAIELLINVLQTPEFSEIIDEISIDPHGTPLSALDDPEYFDEWLNTYLGDYFHAVGTARMGLPDDPGAVVDTQGRLYGAENIFVWDGSILPEVPSANTQLPIAMIAERLSMNFIYGDLS